MRKGASILVVVLAGLSITAAHAQDRGVAPSTTTATTGKRIALVVGNAKYANAPLANPVNDATDMTAVLEKCGFDVTLETDCNLRAMRDALDAFGSNIPKDGVALFYYAGHGMQSRGRNYLIPVGAAPKGPGDLQFDAIDAGLVLSKLEDGNARLNLIILDACRNNPFARSWTRSVPPGLTNMEPPRGSMMMYATSAGSVAQEGNGRNGLFTASLLKNIRQPGLDAFAAFRKTAREVQTLSKGEQVPLLALSYTGEFTFSRGAASWPARHLFIGIEGVSLDPAAAELLALVKPGGIVLTSKNIRDREQTANLVTNIKRAVSLGSATSDLPLIASDLEAAAKLNSSVTLGARELAEFNDLEFTRETASVYAEAYMQLGIGVLLMPSLDIYVPGAPPEVRDRTFGDDELTVTAHGLWFAQGIINGGAIPVVKHYPGMGSIQSNAGRPIPFLNQDISELAPTMYPFIEAARLKIPGILAGHVSVPTIDKSDLPRSAALSPTMINTILRDKSEYDGVVIADDLAMEGVTGGLSLRDAAVEALASGCDAVIVTKSDPAAILEICTRIESAVEGDSLDESALRKSKQRLDHWQELLRDPRPLAGDLPNRLPKSE